MTPPDLKARSKVIGPPKSEMAARLVTVEGEWIAEALPPREHLLIDTRTGKGAVDKTGVWLFAAAGGAGKSYASIDLSLAVAVGGTLFGTFATQGRPGRALMAVAEDDTDDVRRRVNNIASVNGYRAADVAGRFQVLPLKGTFTSLVRLDRNLGTYVMGEGLSGLRELVEEEKRERGAYDLIVIDPIARVAGVSLDKDSDAAAKLMDALDVLSEAGGGLVLAVCHTNKTSRREHADGKGADVVDVRGSSGLTDGARGVISLVPMVGADRKPTGRVLMSCTKGNHVKRWEDVILQRDDHGVLVPVDEIDRAIFEAQRRGQTAEEKGAARETERAARRDREEDAARERSKRRQTARDAEAQAVVDADARVVRQIIAARYTGKLRDCVMARLGCGTVRAGRAIAREQEDSADTPDRDGPHTLG
ncbi:MAG TPA: AAA family ATPase, partial [Polyangia bacterium]|nr:AAA family ATPase [Polyangia bacterium]